MALLDRTPALAPTAGPRIVPARSIRRRKRLERLTYGAMALGLAVGPTTDYWPAHLGAAAVAGLAGWALWRKWDLEPLGWELLKDAHRVLPFLTASAAYLTSLLHPGTPVWEWLLAPVWGAVMAYTTPLTHSAGLVPELLPSEIPAPDTQPVAFTYPQHRAAQWATSKKTGTSLLTNVTVYQSPDGQPIPDFWGIVIAEAGEEVPDLNANALAAVFDLPPGTVQLALIQGSGPGRKLLIAKPTLQALERSDDPIQRTWDEKLAHKNGPCAHMLLNDYKVEPNRIALRTSAPEGQLIQLNQKLIARALEISDASLVMVETDGLGEGLISIYKTHPLMNVREATIEDLTMAADGTIALGMQPDGRVGRVPLYDPVMGAITDLYVGAPGAGKSVTLLHLLAAERISGIVSIAADAQDGMSLPEADGRIYHFGKGIAATAATLAASNDLGKYREKVSAANGWGSFEPGSPWPIANDTLDELNRILSADSTVPRPFRKWVTGLVGDNQSTGRKLGKGIRFAAQSIHLADLGDKDRIRANAKNGTVWLGRTNSSTTQHMARDGVLPPGVEIEPIKRYFPTGSGSAIDAAFEGKEVKHGPITAGTANIINGGSLFMNRTWNAHKENKTYPRLIALMESRPMPRLEGEEHRVFQESYARWLDQAEQLLAGEGEEGGSGEYTAAEAAEARELMDTDEDDDAPSVGNIKDRILDVLADGPMALKDVRRRLPGVAPGSVNNAMGELHNDDGLVRPVSRGVYEIVPN
ncbi:hypothetical protein ACFQ0X_43690 [Streptomyces rectiviolaceus]|uniref:Conjugal transfer protein TraB n=1 Tax=Streptomyces rectiviolaceus TaxID=332591 RepID=A0ABP6NUB9_9ACTN